MAEIDPYTKLLLHMDGDQSASGHEVIFNGNPRFDNSEKKFGKSSLYFDGSGDYLRIPNSSDFNFDTEDFTIDLWVNFTSMGNSMFFSTRHEGESWGYWFNFGWDNGNSRFLHSSKKHYYSSSTTSCRWTVAGGLSEGVWYHVVLEKHGENNRLFLNGEELVLDGGSTEIGSQSYPTSPHDLFIGRDGDGNWQFDGYIDEYRVSKGIARWTENFTPPTQKYTTDSYTKLLLHFEGDEVGNHSLTTIGNPKLDATTTKFNGSMYFDGTGDYLSIPDSEDWDFGTGDFTVDFWVKSSDISGYKMIYYSGDNGLQILTYNNTGKLRIWAGGDNIVAEGATNIFDDEWNHVAVVRNGGTLNAYVNGVYDCGGSCNQNIQHDSLAIGNQPGYSYLVDGYLDELRVSKGIARWTENFTPPGAAYRWPMIGGTLSEDARIIVVNESDDTIEYNGEFSAGNYEIELEDTNYKTVIARKSDGEVVGFGKVIPQ